MTTAQAHPETAPHVYDYASAVAVISLHKGDTVRITGIDQCTSQALHATVTSGGVWPFGIQEARWTVATEMSLAPTYYKLKFRGNPWYGQGTESVPARRLLVAMLRTLLAHGWRVEATCKLSQSQADKDSLVLMRVAPEYVAPADMFAISLNMSDRLRLIDAPESVASIVYATVLESWAPGVIGEREYCGAREFQMRGNPWFGHKDELLAAGVMMAKVLARLKSVGYSLYASVDIALGAQPRQEARDMDSWILIRNFATTA